MRRPSIVLLTVPFFVGCIWGGTISITSGNWLWDLIFGPPKTKKSSTRKQQPDAENHSCACDRRDRKPTEFYYCDCSTWRQDPDGGCVCCAVEVLPGVPCGKNCGEVKSQEKPPITPINPPCPTVEKHMEGCQGGRSVCSYCKHPCPPRDYTPASGSDEAPEDHCAITDGDRRCTGCGNACS